MAVAAAAASSGPPGPDFGALFGLAGAGQQVEGNWRYEAPSLQLPPAGAGPPSPPIAPSRKETTAKQGHQYGHILWPWAGPPPSKKRRYDFEYATPVRAEPIDLVQASKKALQDLLQPLEAEETITAEHMQKVIEFLLSSADEPEALNTISVLHWLKIRSTTNEALQVLAQSVADKAALRTLSTSQLVSALAFFVHRGLDKNTDIRRHITAIADIIPEASWSTIVRKVSHSLRWTKNKDPSVVRYWLRILDDCKYMKGTHYDNATWRSVYQHFALHVKISDLSEHFASLHPEDFVQIALRYWVPYFAALEDDSHTPSAFLKRRTAGQGHLILSFQRVKLSEDSIQSVVDCFEGLRAEKTARASLKLSKPNRHRWEDHALTDLLVALARHHIPCDNLLLEIVQVYKLHQNPNDSLWSLYRTSLLHPELAMPHALALKLLLHFSIRSQDTGSLRRAWLIFKNVPTISVLDCFELPLKLIERGYGTPDRIHYMLNRKTREDIVPPESRVLTTQADGDECADGTPLKGQQNCSLRPEHIDLVHLIAYHWAKQERYNSRICFRRVWDCCRFLQDRGAPLSILMSRALVKAGILRPLQETKYLTLGPVRYIMKLVTRLEGEHVAQRLDKLVFEARRNNNAHKFRALHWAPAIDEGMARRVEWRLRRAIRAKVGKTPRRVKQKRASANNRPLSRTIVMGSVDRTLGAAEASIPQSFGQRQRSITGEGSTAAKSASADSSSSTPPPPWQTPSRAGRSTAEVRPRSALWHKHWSSHVGV
ncbi:hypothetical protein B0A50_08169 [Salinomyces thailandicus]|uniref:Uncharacterized protein n=1 Tax=Salinomyces thailandicus TaxID=706561 RepID=A0A4U0TKE7_9PEZI|nr:hypothetical protein B0A50_08169 [Salinomyces thailandica]